MTGFLIGLGVWLVGIPIAGYLMEQVEHSDTHKVFSVVWPLLLPIGVLVSLGSLGVAIARRKP